MKEKTKLQGVIMTPFDPMKLIVIMNKLLSEQHGVTFVPPDRLITKEEFYAQKNSVAQIACNSPSRQQSAPSGHK